MTRDTTATTASAVARGYTRIPSAGNDPTATKRAVIYLRVSTAQQANTDHDSEGFSIPAQRDACLRKAAALDASVVDEYVDKGESARRADRPALRSMLERLSELRDVDYVIVHKVDRLARNRVDDVNINLAIRQAGAQLVSVAENIDETPSGMLLHGIMSSIAEFYSKNLATEIMKGMDQKAKKGGHPGKAPIGYLNVRQHDDGKEIRTIVVDPDRAPLVKWAFEAYASGEYGLTQLTEELADRGLRHHATAKQPERPMLRSKVAWMLSNPFYVGIVTWGGVQYPGRHAPLVSIESYASVQAMLQAKRQGGERQRKYHHYLKGSLFCGRCESRMSFSRSRGHGGEYDYFFCLGRHERRTECTLPYLRPDDVEEAIDSYYATIQTGPETLEVLRTHLLEALRLQTEAAEREARRQRTRITRLEAERRKLLQAHLAGAVPLDLLSEEQDRLTRELANAGAALANTEVHWETIEENLDLALQLAADPQAAYRRADAQGRRALNQAFFEALYVDAPERVAYARLAEPFAALLAEDLAAFLEQDMKNPDSAMRGRGSRNARLVEVMGLEPTTSTLRT